MKCSLGFSNFLEEISRLSHSIVFIYFFALIAEEGFLISPCYSLKLCIQMDISFLFSFAFHFSSLRRQHIKKQRHYFANKGHIVKAMVFPVVMYGCESWTIRKAECQRMDAFELWCWRRLLRVPWTAIRSNQSNLKEISPEYSLEGLMLNLQYFGHLMRRADAFERPWYQERSKAVGKGGDRGWDGWMTSLTQWTRVWVGSGSWWWTGKPGVLQSMGSQRAGHNWMTENQQQLWKTPYYTLQEHTYKI